MQFRNIAIIAHVDHGKTTLVDGLLRQCHAFAEHEKLTERVMDSMDLERERGITITSKNTAVFYGDVKINIVDTPGHADFGGEVERVLTMVEGALLLVDASEGPLPQTRFVLGKAMEAGLEIMVCINKIDRPDARIEEVLQEIYDLFIDLDADDEQLEFPIIYACARDGIAHAELGDGSTDLRPLLDKIVAEMPPPAPGDDDGAQLLVTNLDYDSYVGRLCLGRLRGSPLKRSEMVTWFGAEKEKRTRLQLLYTWRGLKRHEVTEAYPGDIVAIAGIEGVTVGDTIATGDVPRAMPRVIVDEPTIGMLFNINTSPFSGRSGKLLTSRQILERLERELISNVSMRMDPSDTGEGFMVYGRGELQLAILIEQMRREGFELTVSRPEVLTKETADGKTLEPWEHVTVDTPNDYVGALTQNLAGRKGQMLDLKLDGDRTRLEYRVPSRGLIGFRGEMLTETRGEGVLNTLFDGWDESAGYIQARLRGALVNDRTGKTNAYGLFHLQPRGELLVGVGEEVYEGMIIGIHNRENDLNVNGTKAKQLTNIRSSGADEKLVLATPRTLTLETALEFIDDDERVEITPTHIRVRKAILKTNMRSIVRGDKQAKMDKKKKK
jgi:GTP-binding protein